MDRERFRIHLILPFKAELYHQALPLVDDIAIVDLQARKKDMPYLVPAMRSILEIRRYLGENSIQLCIPTSMFSLYFASAALAFRGTPKIIAWLHAFPIIKTGYKRFFYSLSRRLLFGKVESIIVVSKALERAMREQAPDIKIHTIPNFLPEKQFDQGDGERIRSQLGIPTQAKIILNVGRLHPGKGQMIMLKAFRLIREKIDNAHLVFLGEEFSTHLESLGFADELRLLARQWGLEACVHFPGFRSDIVDFLAAADILAHPSFEETFGLAVLEAQAAGVPVIASDVGGIRELIVDGQNGLLVPAGDFVSLADACQMIINDEKLASILVENGKENAARYGSDIIYEMESLFWRYAEDVKLGI